MPRIARKDLKSNFLHIIVQGINKEYIFENNKYKDAYKYLLKKNLNMSNIKLLAYCIMDNHVHLLIYGENIKDISKMMQKINTSYAKLYNKSKNRVGYVFRDRFYSQMILNRKQLVNCLVYIHNNPVKAKMVEKLENYEYSSYIEYIGKKDLIVKDAISSIFGNDESNIQIFYKIHKVAKIENIEDIIDVYQEKDSIIQSFIEKTNKKLEDIKQDENLLANLLIELKKECGLSIRDMSNIFKINKNRIMNMMKKEKNK